MTTDTVLSLLHSLEEIANRRCLRSPGTSSAISRDYDEGCIAAALEIKDAIRKAEEIVQAIGTEATAGMSLFDFGTLLRTMRELQELARQAPQSNTRRANAARYELRVDQLLKIILRNDESRNYHLPIN